MCHNYVWCHGKDHIQERWVMVQWSLQVQDFSQINYLHICVCLSKKSSITWDLDINNTGCVKTSRLFCVGTKLMWKIDKWRRSKLNSIGRRICSTMRYLQRAITILRNPFYILLEDLSETQTFVLWSHLHLLHQKFTLTLLFSKCKYKLSLIWEDSTIYTENVYLYVYFCFCF